MRRPSHGYSLWGLTLAIALGAAGTTGALDRVGAARRTMSAPRRVDDRDLQVLVVGTGHEAVAAWRARGLRGRRILHFGRFLHFIPRDPAIAATTLTVPGTGGRLDEVLSAGSSQRDYLWVAASLDVGRRIDYVSPAPSLDARLADLGLDRSALPLAADADDFPRSLHASVPRIDEPVLVSVNASWFDEASAEVLVDGLRAAGIRTDLVVVDLARDADDVSGPARARARELASALARGVDRP